MVFGQCGLMLCEMDAAVGVEVGTSEHLPSGTVTFDGAPETPTLDIRAVYNVPQYRDRDLGVIVNLRGRVPNYTLENCAPPDVLIVPGGIGTRPLLGKPALLEWLRLKTRRAELVMSICTGALVLAKAGLLVSHAGTDGGYALAKPAGEISAFEVIRAIDGPLFITSCITIHGACDLTSTCTIKEPLRKVNDSIKDLLSGIHIADLIEADGEQGGTGAPVGGGLVSIAI